MKSNPEFQVTLSPELLDCLRARARELGVPLKYLVASLICDTIDPVAMTADERPAERRCHVA